MYVNTKLIADAISEGNRVSEKALQLQKDLAYNKMLEDTFEDRVFAQNKMKFKDMSLEGQIIARKYLYTNLLRDVY